MSTVRLQKRGFTLVETLVAITVLLLVVIGPITVAQKGIKSAYYANEQVTAVFLAQEAIEAVRELRDTQALIVYDGGSEETLAWYDGSDLDSCKVNDFPQAPEDNEDGSGGCAFDPVDGIFESCSQNNGCRLTINQNQEYTHAQGEDSGFTRRVYVGETLVGGGVPVMVMVTWQSRMFSGSPIREVVLETWVYDHYQRYKDF